MFLFYHIVIYWDTIGPATLVHFKRPPMQSLCQYLQLKILSLTFPSDICLAETLWMDDLRNDVACVTGTTVCWCTPHRMVLCWVSRNFRAFTMSKRSECSRDWMWPSWFGCLCCSPFSGSFSGTFKSSVLWGEESNCVHWVDYVIDKSEAYNLQSNA